MELPWGQMWPWGASCSVGHFLFQEGLRYAGGDTLLPSATIPNAVGRAKCRVASVIYREETEARGLI